MALRLQRHLGSVATIEPGQWTAETASGRPAVCCPACSSVDEVLSVVLPGGAVALAYRCESGECAFHEWIELEAFGE